MQPTEIPLILSFSPGKRAWLRGQDDPPKLLSRLVSHIRVIFFDAAGTLFHVEGSVGDVYLGYAEKYGVPRTPDMLAAVNAAFRRAFQDAPPPVFALNDPAEVKRCERLWWFDIVHAVFYRVGMFEGFDEYFDEVYEGFNGPRHWTLYPETVEVLSALRARGYELGVISNFDTRLFTVLRGLGLLDHFDTVTISTLTRAAKPSPRVFEAALEKHAVDPDEAVHVGDSRAEDAEAAAAAKLIGIWLDREGRAGREQGAAYTGHRIESLVDLPKLLDSLEYGEE